MRERLSLPGFYKEPLNRYDPADYTDVLHTIMGREELLQLSASTPLELEAQRCDLELLVRNFYPGRPLYSRSGRFTYSTDLQLVTDQNLIYYMFGRTTAGPMHVHWGHAIPSISITDMLGIVQGKRGALVGIYTAQNRLPSDADPDAPEGDYGMLAPPQIIRDFITDISFEEITQPRTSRTLTI